ncbi:MAG: hypothetical protein OXE78_07715 [Gammaproteobacteria bacterium]|nr:hypothetical protein [Gammaproteobacteria bacterium]
MAWAEVSRLRSKLAEAVNADGIARAKENNLPILADTKTDNDHEALKIAGSQTKNVNHGGFCQNHLG